MPIKHSRRLVAFLPAALAMGLGIFVIGRLQPAALRDAWAWLAWLAFAGLGTGLWYGWDRRQQTKPKILAGAATGLWLGGWYFSPTAQAWHFSGLAVSVLIGTILRRLWLTGFRLNRRLWSEGLRWLLLTAVTLFILHPFFTASLVGGGDMRFYAQVLADFLEQWRSGMGPVLVGQSEYAFNGEVHPLRTAPGLFYLGGLLDLLTWRSLSAVALQNLLLGLSGLAAALSCYHFLCRLAPRQGWSAWLLTLFFISSPGVLAPLYSGDMVASWLTLPWLPWFFFALMQTVDRPAEHRWPVQAAAALALVWWFHAPIAFWTTLAAAPFALRYLWAGRPYRPHALVVLGLGGLFLACTGFVFVSTLALEIPPSPNLRNDILNGAIEYTLNQAWLGFFRPVSPGATELLHDLQLSPGLWIVLLLGLFALGRVRRVSHGLFAIGIVALALLLLPAVAPVWGRMPDIVIDATEKWPTQRFFIILSCLVPFFALPALAHYRRQQPKFTRDVTIILLLAGAWSLVESYKFVRRGGATTLPIALTVQQMRPENVRLSRYSYEYYGRLPRYHSHGPTNAWSQTRLLAADTLEPLQDNARWLLARPAPPNIVELKYEATDYGGHFSPALNVGPNQAYLLHVDFQGALPAGVIQLMGRTLWAEYALPDSGEERAFGAGPGRDPTITLIHDRGPADAVDIKFIRTPGQSAEMPAPKLRAIRYDQAGVPLQITSLMPFRLTVRSNQAAWLETPKLFVPGYRAQVDGQDVPLALSPDGLVMLPVPAGSSQVELTYPGSLGVQIAFWLGALAWLGLLAGGLRSHLPANAGAFLDAAVFLPRFGRIVLRAGCLALLVGGATVAWRYVRAEAPVFQADRSLTLVKPFPVGRPRDTVETLHTFSQDLISGKLLLKCVDGKQASLGYAMDGQPPVFGAPFPVNYLATQKIRLELTTPQSSELHVRVNERLVLKHPLPPGQ